MLQQTQVKTVIPYFERFIATFPTVTALANAHEDAVLALWSGLGYYSRARNLHRSARIVIQEFSGLIPQNIQELITLPGVGASTAAAICSLAYNQPTAILEGNVKRIIARYFLISGASEKAETKKQLLQHAKQCMPAKRCQEYTQAIMDLGALICTPRNPQCSNCPLHTNCLAYQQGVVDAFPEKKTKKKRPEYEQEFILFYTREPLIYLEKRPASGIWGGLWCLSEKSQHPLADSLETWPIMNITHTFSHFIWHITAQALEIKPEIIDNKTLFTIGAWVSPAKLNTLGLSKPIQNIIQRFLHDFGEHAPTPQSHRVAPRPLLV